MDRTTDIRPDPGRGARSEIPGNGILAAAETGQNSHLWPEQDHLTWFQDHVLFSSPDAGDGQT